MSDKKFEEAFSDEHLKQMTIRDIKRANRECFESGYEKGKLLTLARLITQFKKDFPAAPEIASLDKLAQKVMEQLIKIKSTDAPKSPDVIETEEKNENFINERFPALPPEELDANTLYNISVIENQNRYKDKTFLLYSPFEDELVHFCKCYASKNEKPLRVIDFKKLKDALTHEVSHIISEIFSYARVADNEVIALLNVEEAAKNDAVSDSLWESVYSFRAYVFENYRYGQENHFAELLLLSTDLECGIESRYTNYVKAEYPKERASNLYLYNVTSGYVTLVPKEKTVSLLCHRFNIAEDDEKLLKTIGNCGIFLGWKGLSDVIANARDTSELEKQLERAKKDKKEILDNFLAISNRSLSLFSLFDWNYKISKTEPIKIPPLNPEDPVLNPHYTLKGRHYDEIMPNEEIAALLERLINVPSVPLMAKCAWAANFAMSGGDNLNIENIQAEEERDVLIDRWELAFHAVARLLLLETPSLLFDIPENDTLNGECCNGGATVRMNKKFLNKKNVSDGIGTLLHELYHAVQAKSKTALNAVTEADRIKAKIPEEENNILNYYYHHLGVSRYHIQQWAENDTRYRSPDPKFEDYYDQVVEADARIFSADAISKNAIINHPRLDDEDENT